MCAHPVSEGGREEERLERKGGGEGGRRKGGKMEGEKKWEGNVVYMLPAVLFNSPPPCLLQGWMKLGSSGYLAKPAAYRR